jgi:hypothetical protein
MKHFEQLWEEAELVAAQYYVDKSSIEDIGYSAIAIGCDDSLSIEEKEELLGKVIFGLCLLSKKFNINSYTALRSAIDNAKIEMLEEI